MKEIDFERALTLMQVIKEVANTSPQAQEIAGQAQQELNAILEDAKANARETADKRREEEANREASRMKELRAAGTIAELPNETGHSIDSDDDGIEDEVDLDDDNDGEEDTTQVPDDEPATKPTPTPIDPRLRGRPI